MIKRIALFTGFLFFMAFNVSAQVPNSFKYQAVVRNAEGSILKNQQVNLTISILQSSITGSPVFEETHDSTTNAYGLVTLNIGAGNPTDFANIDWSNGPYFVRVEMDGSLMGTSPLLSVPYAMHAKTADTVTGAITETDPIFGSSVASGITGTDTTNWNNKLDSYTETDPSVPTATQTGEMQYWDGTEWITVSPGNEGQVLTLSGGVPTWVTTVGPTDVYNPTTGEIWMDRNLGASQVATSSTDYLAYGDLYQWGRASDGHETIVWTSSTTSDGAEQANETDTLSSTDTPGHGNFITSGSFPFDWRNPQNDNLWQGASGTNNPCPSGYRLPTEAEWEAERTSWSSNNAAGAFASPLKLPVAGERGFSNGSFYNVGSKGYYWSSTVDGIFSWLLGYGSTNVFMTSDRRARGYSIRCIKD